MRLSEAILEPLCLRYVVDELPVQSGVARRMLLERSAMTDAEKIRAYYEHLRVYCDAVTIVQNDVARRNLQFRLQGLKDIRTTLERLLGGEVLDDIELFEVKHLAMLYEEVEKQMGALALPSEHLPMAEVVSILDPDGLRIATFYIYDSYSERLRTLRKTLEERPTDEQVFVAVQEEERHIREDLSGRLRAYAADLQRGLTAMAEADILLAQAVQIKEMGFCLPQISEDGRLVLEQMWNPEVKASLDERHKTYQRNSITLGEEPTILTGSNMGGKTIVLRTVGLCQMLFLFGFGIPAGRAVLPIRERVYCTMSDGQSVSEGLSSFAAEIKSLNTIVAACRRGENLLALIDEPARTTNPIEGTALVSALIDVLRETKRSVLIVTHYTVDAHHCPCLRVKGLVGDTMDYGLIEAREGEVPQEALRIAEQLGIDSEWLQRAKEVI